MCRAHSASYVDQGYTGERAAEATSAHGIELEVVKLPEVKTGFILLPRRWAVERLRQPREPISSSMTRQSRFGRRTHAQHGRAALVLTPGDCNKDDAPGRVPPGTAPD